MLIFLLQWQVKAVMLLNDWQMIWLNNTKEEKYLVWNLFPKLATDTRWNGIYSMFPLSCADAWQRSKWNDPTHTELWQHSKWNGPEHTELWQRSKW
jgi:hypothetical protein